MKSSQEDKVNATGRAIARGMQDLKVEREKNMAKAAKRQQTMLERAAEKALSGSNSR